MREFAKISPQFWINENGRKIKQLGQESQLVALYLLTSPHSTMLGIYYLPVTFIAHETGLPLEEASKGLQRLIEANFCSYDAQAEYVWVHEMAFEQIGAELKPNDNRVKAINETYKNLPNLVFLPAFYNKYQQAFFLNNEIKFTRDSEAPLETLASKEKEKEKDKKKIIMSGKPDVYTLSSEIIFDNNTPPQSKPSALKSQALEILQFLNEKTGRVYRPVPTNLKLIECRLKTGATVMDCRQVIAKKTREWKGDHKMAEYLRPATLFNATKFEQYLGELVLPQDENLHGSN